MADQSLPIEGTLDLTPVHTPRLTWLEVVHEWVTTVDHKKLGLMYMMMAIFFLLVAGAEVLCIRIQLAWPDNHFLSPQVFNRFFTMHGTTMVFLMGIPLIFGFGNYIIPLQIGASERF
jgi:cytochrome c oxidase subunit I